MKRVEMKKIGGRVGTIILATVLTGMMTGCGSVADPQELAGPAPVTVEIEPAPPVEEVRDEMNAQEDAGIGSADEGIGKEDSAEAEEKEETGSTDGDGATDEPQDGGDANDSGDDNASEDAVDPDLKAFLDSYEEFMDEYVDFMKKYTADPANMVSMMTEYAEIMGKYAEFSEAIEKYDTETMSTADAKYYIDVTARVSKKLLEIY